MTNLWIFKCLILTVIIFFELQVLTYVWANIKVRTRRFWKNSVHKSKKKIYKCNPYKLDLVQHLRQGDAEKDNVYLMVSYSIKKQS